MILKMKATNEISRIVSALVTNSILPTRNDLVSKLPPQIEGIEKETLEEVLTQIYRKAVESREDRQASKPDATVAK